MVQICSSLLLSFFGAWTKSITAHPGLGRLRLDARLSVRLLGGATPSHILLQDVAMPQKEGSSECDPSELPSDGESLNAGGSNLCVRGAGSEVTAAPLHRIPPLYSKDGLRVSTFSTGFILRRLFCGGKQEVEGRLATVHRLQLGLTLTQLGFNPNPNPNPARV